MDAVFKKSAVVHFTMCSKMYADSADLILLIHCVLFHERKKICWGINFTLPTTQPHNLSFKEVYKSYPPFRMKLQGGRATHQSF